jgi:cell division transport system permease protein
VISFLAFSISRAWQSFWRNAAMSLAATATMTLMLLLLSGFWIVQAGLLAGLALLLVIGAIVLFIVINTIRLAVVGRSEEIEIMRLVGASDAFIRWPFVFEGAMVGLLGAALTLGVLGLASDPLGRLMFDFFRVLPLSIGSISRDVGLLVTGAGLGLGVLGAWISVRTYLIR